MNRSQRLLDLALSKVWSMTTLRHSVEIKVHDSECEKILPTEYDEIEHKKKIFPEDDCFIKTSEWINANDFENCSADECTFGNLETNVDKESLQSAVKDARLTPQILVLSQVQVSPPLLLPHEKKSNDKRQAANNDYFNLETKSLSSITHISSTEYNSEADNRHDENFNADDYASNSSTSSDLSEISEHPDVKSIEVHVAKKILIRSNTVNSHDVNKQNANVRLSEKIKDLRDKTKKVIRCKYCNNDIFNKNFMRHLQRRHANEKEIKSILEFPIGSKERRHGLSLLINETNFELYIKGLTRPNRLRPSTTSDSDIIYYPCAYCKGLFIKRYLNRHVKSCIKQTSFDKDNKINHLSTSQTLTACAMDPTKVISTLNVKEQVFDNMKADQIAFEAKKDLLIAHFGESYLKKHRREGVTHACSNRMREFSRLLIEYRKIVNSENISLKDLLQPKNFDNVIFATRNLVGYDPFKKTFQAPSLAMHLGTSLKLACDECIHLILKESKGFQCTSPAESQILIQNLKNFKTLIETRWNTELASLANKDLQEKRWNKSLLLPLVKDVKKFRDEILSLANECYNEFLQNKDNQQTYKLLVQCSISLLIIFNRRRIGDVQYLKVQDYLIDKKTNHTDFENILTETEKKLTKYYKRVLNSGKGSRVVVILIPETLQKFINILIKHRGKYIPIENDYVFAIPGSKIKWGKGDVAIRTLTKRANLEHPEAITSNKLRKHIATVMQILNLSHDEAKQFSHFMGHTEKTHSEFYELPVDIYQTARVSKLLLMMEKGTLPLEHKGKSLSEINIDLEYAEEDELDCEETTNLNKNDEENETRMSRAESRTLDNSTDIAVTNPKPEETSSKRGTQRKCWTNNEISRLKLSFQNYIQSGTYPPASEIKAFIDKYRLERSVAVIKSKIQHLIKTKNV